MSINVKQQVSHQSSETIILVKFCIRTQENQTGKPDIAYWVYIMA